MKRTRIIVAAAVVAAALCVFLFKKAAHETPELHRPPSIPYGDA